MPNGGRLIPPPGGPRTFTLGLFCFLASAFCGRLPGLASISGCCNVTRTISSYSESTHTRANDDPRRGGQAGDKLLATFGLDTSRHRAGLRLYWKWLSRKGSSGGRKPVSREIRHGERHVSMATSSRWASIHPKQPCHDGFDER